MIKKIFYILLFVFTCFIGLNHVSAEATRQYMSYNSYLFQIGNPGILYTTPKTFTNRITFSEITSEYDRYSTLYTRYALCTGENIYSTSSNISVVNTNIKCSNYGNIGKLSFLTGAFNEDFLYSSTISADNVATSIYDTNFSFFGSLESQFTLYGVDIGRSLDNFPTYDSNSEVLDKLDSLNESVDYYLSDIKYSNGQILLYILKIYENMVTCRDSYNLFDGEFETGYINVSNGVNASTSTNIRTKNYISIKPDTIYTFSSEISNDHWFLYYDKNKNFISYFGSSSNRKTFTTPQNAYYIRWYIVNYTNTSVKEQLQLGSSSTAWEPYGEQICKSKVDETNDAINESNKKLDETNNKLQQQQDFMNNDDTSESSNEAKDFFEGFDSDTYGLTSIITAPLELIGNIVGSTCSPLPLEIPFVGGTFNLPCMSSIYKKHFGSFLTIYQTITFGIVAYWVCVRIFALVKDFKNPEHDEIEVMDL